MMEEGAKQTSLVSVLLLAAILAVNFDSGVTAEENSRSIEQFVDDGVWAIMCTDFSRWAGLGSEDVLSDVLRIKYPWDEKKRRKLAENLKQQAPVFNRMGIEKNWILMSPQDVFFRGGFPLFFSVGEGGNHNEVLRMAKKLAISSDFVGHEHLPITIPFKEAEWFEDSRIVISGTFDVIEHYANLKPTSRPDLFRPLNELLANGAIIAIVISPDRHARRAVRELWPSDAPPPLDEIDGKIIAEGVSWIGFELRAKPRPLGRLIIELNTESLAKQLHAWINQKLQWLANLRSPDMDPGDQTPTLLTNVLRPHRSEKRIILELESNGSQIKALHALINPVLNAARSAAANSKRQSDFREIALALLDHEYKHKRFPAAHSVDSKGKPLLSWRVHILPFLGEVELYEKFHLNEPWDSEHNQRLIARMPSVYADKGDTTEQLLNSGRTTVVAPISASTLFASSEGAEYHCITDKPSTTLMIAEVAPEKAVVWTSPQDWNVNFDSALADIKRANQDYFITAFCDGSTKKLPSNIAIDQLKAVLTIDGGEYVSP